jgi:hypothetical protein
LGVDAPLIDGAYLNGIHNGGVYNSFNWKPESYLFKDFRPDLLYYGGRNNMSGMGAVWELKPISQMLPRESSLLSVSQINEYVGELNAKNEGGLRWATGTTAIGSPKPFEGKLNLMDDKYKFEYNIYFPEQGFIYYSYNLLKQPQQQPQQQLVSQPVPNSSLDPKMSEAIKRAGFWVGAAAVGTVVGTTILQILENVATPARLLIMPIVPTNTATSPDA